MSAEQPQAIGTAGMTVNPHEQPPTPTPPQWPTPTPVREETSHTARRTP